MGIIGYVFGLYWDSRVVIALISQDNGKEHGNYYIIWGHMGLYGTSNFEGNRLYPLSALRCHYPNLPHPLALGLTITAFMQSIRCRP